MRSSSPSWPRRSRGGRPPTSATAIYLNMKYFFLGRRIRHCGYAEAWNLRLFKHRLGRYEKMPVEPGTQTGDNEAHEHVELQGKVGRLDHELDHHAYPTIAAWVEKHNRYAIWEAAMYERFLNEPVPTSLDAGKRLKRRLKKVYLRLPLRPADPLRLRLHRPARIPRRDARARLLHPPVLLRLPLLGERLRAAGRGRGARDRSPRALIAGRTQAVSSNWARGSSSHERAWR